MNIRRAFLLTVILVISLLIFPVTGCSNVKNEGNILESDDVFSIYLLSERVEGKPPYNLDEFELPEKPWLSIEDIDYYDFSTHYIYLKTDKASLFGDEWHLSTPSAFMVVAGGERCYLGHFLSLASSWLPLTPTINCDPAFNLDFDLYPKDVIYISYYKLNDTEDPRSDPRIENALSGVGKLSPGISVKLDDVRIDKRNGITGVSYTFTVTNETKEALYVPDPDKMGVNLFHYFTGGLYLRRSDVYIIVLSAYDSTVQPYSYENFDIAWFTRLKPHKSMKRTLTFDADAIVSKENYTCSFRYTGPSRIEKDDRLLSNGQIWIGEVDSGTIGINIVE